MEFNFCDWIPPVILELYGRIRGRQTPFRTCATWKEAKEASTGYDTDLILEKIRDSMSKVKNGEAVYERDSVLFDKIRYSWPLLAGILWVASQKANRLNLVDFGGSLGSTYYQNRRFLSHLIEMHWSIVEQRKFVECGKRDFENEHLKFYDDLDECFREQRPDAILFSSVIQYLENPYALLEKARSLGFEFIFFDRTPFLERGPDRITVQRVPPAIYEASYPAWFFDQGKFVEFFSRDYELIAEFEALAGTIWLGKDRATDKGYIFRKRRDVTLPDPGDPSRGPI
jgi:putative methyltransferase (TIGR04325 family)